MYSDIHLCLFVCLFYVILLCLITVIMLGQQSNLSGWCRWVDSIRQKIKKGKVIKCEYYTNK